MGAPSLRVNMVWAVFGNAVAAFSLWVLLVFLAKVASVETVGTFAVAQAVGLPISVLLSFKLQQVQVTDARNDYVFGHYVALKIVLAILMVLVTAVAGFAFYPTETAVAITALGVSYAVIELREIYLATMQKSERMDQMTISRVLQGVSSLLLFVVLYWPTRSLFWGIVGLVISRVAVLIWYDIPVNRRLLADRGAPASAVHQQTAPCWQWRRLWRLAVLAAPLGLVGWLCMLFFSVPRLVLDKYAGTKEVGYFAAIGSLLSFGNMMTGAVSQTVAPRLAKYFDQNRAAFLVLLGKLAAMSLAVGLAGVLASVLCGRAILTLLFTSAYAEHNDVFIILMVASCLLFLFSCANTALTAAQRYAVQMPLYALAALTAIGSAYLLIPRYGMVGAAWSLTLCYVVGFVGCTLAVLQALRSSAVPRPAVCETGL